MTDWQKTQLTRGTADNRFHAHSYYDVEVFDSTSRFIAGHELCFTMRHPKPDDPVAIGYLDLDGDREWTPIGESRAWSWQQGPLTQWLPNSSNVIWNDREGDAFVSRIHDVQSGQSRALPNPIYAVDPAGRFGLSLNMARLDAVRPGYGYPGGSGALLDQRHPAEDGVWKVDLHTGEKELLLSVERAVSFLMSQLRLRKKLIHWKERYVYWFNHVKICPSGTRFTVKLRYRSRNPRKGWNDQQGVSLTCGTDGEDLRLLTDGTSHVIWLSDQQLYLWQRDGVYLYADEGPVGRRVMQLAPGRISQNVHIRHLQPDARVFVYDTPYQEEIEVFLFDSASDTHTPIAQFNNHIPKRGPFRCDLHPCPSRDGRKILITSLEDGGRQLYLLSR